MTDESLIVEYSKEVLGSLYSPGNEITVEQLIEHSRKYREIVAKSTEVSRDGYRDGYNKGYQVGLSAAGRNTINVGDLRSMTIQDFATLINES